MSRWLPGAARRFWWADMQLWAEVWDAVSPSHTVCLAGPRKDTPDRASAERPSRGAWSDPQGPGRCARCAQWLRGADTYVWRVRRRTKDVTLADVHLCGECTRVVLDVWRHTDYAG